MELFQCWHYSFHRILRTDPCHFGGNFLNIVMFGKRDSGCAASKSKRFLAPHLTNFLTAAQKEAPRNLRDPEADGRLGKREKSQPARKTAASTQTEAGERPRCPGRAARLQRGAAPTPEREVPQATSDSAQIAAAPHAAGTRSEDGGMDGRMNRSGSLASAAGAGSAPRAFPRRPAGRRPRSGGKEGGDRAGPPAPWPPLPALSAPPARLGRGAPLLETG